MRGTIINELNSDSEEMRLYQQEWLILEVTELIAELMEKKGIKKNKLAQLLGKSKGYITQLLDGRANMTLRTVADVMWALDSSLGVSSQSLGFASSFESEVKYDFTKIMISLPEPEAKPVPAQWHKVA